MVHLMQIYCMLIVATLARGNEICGQNHAALDSMDTAHCGYIPAAPDSKDDYRHLEEDGQEDSEESLQLLQMGTAAVRRQGRAAPKQALSPGKAYVLYKHAHLMQELLAERDIVAWASGGTLLGAMRNGGVIPHDDDCDFTIFEHDIHNAFEALSQRMRIKTNIGHPNMLKPDYRPRADRAYFHWKVYYNDTYNGDMYTSHLDVFVAEMMVANGYTDPSAIVLRDQLPERNRSAQLEFTQNLVSIPFGCSTVMAPSKEVSNEYLDAEYGKGWADEVKCAGWHDCNLLSDVDHDLKNMAEPCYSPDERPPETA